MNLHHLLFNGEKLQGTFQEGRLKGPKFGSQIFEYFLSFSSSHNSSDELTDFTLIKGYPCFLPFFPKDYFNINLGVKSCRSVTILLVKFVPRPHI